jgi:hypothetical protein
MSYRFGVVVRVGQRLDQRVALAKVRGHNLAGLLIGSQALLELPARKRAIEISEPTKGD